MRGYLTGRTLSGEISGSIPMSGIYDGATPEPPSPTPVRDSFYTGHMTDVGHENYITVWTKTKEAIT